MQPSRGETAPCTDQICIRLYHSQITASVPKSGLPMERSLLFRQLIPVYAPIAALGFPDSSVGKESVCNGGDPSSIPGPGRSPGEGIGYPLQYS